MSFKLLFCFTETLKKCLPFSSSEASQSKALPVAAQGLVWERGNRKGHKRYFSFFLSRGRKPYPDFVAIIIMTMMNERLP